MYKKSIKSKKQNFNICLGFLILIVLINFVINNINMKGFHAITQMLLLWLSGLGIFALIRYGLCEFIYMINEEGVKISRIIGKKEEEIVFVPFDKIKYIGENDKKDFGKIKRKINCGQSFSKSKLQIMVFENSHGNSEILYFEPDEEFISFIKSK